MMTPGQVAFEAFFGYFEKMGAYPEFADDWEFSREGWEAVAKAVYNFQVLGIMPDRSLTHLTAPTSR